METVTASLPTKNPVPVSRKALQPGKMVVHSMSVYMGVTGDVLSRIDQDRFKLPLECLYYHDASFDMLIIEFAISVTRYDLFTIGSMRIASMGKNRSKEPDEAFRPKNTRSYEAGLPTLCIEVGRSESLNQLRNDAHFWLTHMDREVRVVILIHIQADNKKLHIEHWQMIQRQLSRTPGDASPIKIQEFDLYLLSDGTTASANPSSASLDIATELLFDILPQGATKDYTVTIAPDRLISFIHEYYRAFR